MVRRSPFTVLRSSLVLLSFLVLSSWFCVSSSSAQEPVFKSGSAELVVLPVVVTDRQGRYVSDLPGERFTVFDNELETIVPGGLAADKPVQLRRIE